jgi:hypothetical protein
MPTLEELNFIALARCIGRLCQLIRRIDADPVNTAWVAEVIEIEDTLELIFGYDAPPPPSPPQADQQKTEKT